MDLPDATLMIWALSLGHLWLNIRAVIDVAKSPRSDNAKAGWITVIVGVPVIGILFYWLCGAGPVADGTLSPEQREAALKARLNAGVSARHD